MKLIIPLGYSKVSEGVYRSSYPANKTLPFIKQLGIKSFISLCPSDTKQDLIEFVESHSINLLQFDIKFNQEPFLVMSESEMVKIVDYISAPENQPALVFCTNGKVKTGCVVACYRRRQGWSLSSTIAEFEQFAEPEGTFSDIQFIENFPVASPQQQQHQQQQTVSTALSQSSLDNNVCVNNVTTATAGLVIS